MTVDAFARWLGLVQRTADTRAVAALLVANAIPLAGVLFLGWSLWTILVIYWLENAIVGLFSLPRILLARGEIAPGLDPEARARVAAVPPIASRALFALFFFGGEVISGFSIALIWGIVIGTYSSIALAVPALP